MSTDLRACWCSFLIIFGFFSYQNQKEYRILNSAKMNGTRGRYVAASEASSRGQNMQIQTRVNRSKAYQRESKDCHANLNIPLRRPLPKILKESADLVLRAHGELFVPPSQLGPNSQVNEYALYYLTLNYTKF